MKHTISYMMCLWAALALAACTSDDDPAWPEGGVPLELYAAVAGYEGDGADTRAATTENRWEGGEVVHLVVFTDNQYYMRDDFINPDGKSISCDFANWTKPDDIRRINALYPARMANFTFFVEKDQTSEGYQQSDCMATPQIEITLASPDKTLIFCHLTAKVVVHLKAGNGIADEEIRNAAVTFENLSLNVSSKRNNGIANQVTPGGESIWPNEVTPAATGYVRIVRALLSPQDLSGRKMVKVVIGNKTFYYTPGAGEANFFSGKMYEYRLTVTPMGIEQTTVEGGTWQPAS